MNTRLTAIATVITIVTTSCAFAAPKDDLMAVDRAFAKMSLEKGYDQAYIANLASDGQTFTGAAPIRNKADAVARLADPKAHHSEPIPRNPERAVKEKAAPGRARLYALIAKSLRSDYSHAADGDLLDEPARRQRG
jgi:hypothetical protein